MYRADEPTQTGNKNHSVIGDLARVDPEAAAKKILAAHRKHGGVSARAAGELGIYYQTLRSLIVRLSGPVTIPKTNEETTLGFTVGAQEGLTLEQAIAALRAKATGADKDTPEPDELRKEIDALFEKGVRASAIARAVKLGDGRTLDEGLFSRWRAGKKPLPPDTLAKIQAVVRALAKAKKPKANETRGRKAARSRAELGS